jgi:hypothetical protein
VTYRFKTTNLAVPIAGTSVAHGLAFTPDEYFYVYRGSPPAATNVNALVFFSSTPVDATNVNISAGSTGTIDLFAAYNHSIIR